jgi:hypothetical protein
LRRLIENLDKMCTKCEKIFLENFEKICKKFKKFFC